MAIDVPASERPDFGEGRLYFVGNATTVIRYGGFSILTDPASSTPASTCTWATAPTRAARP